MRHINITLKGKVQRVSFRASAKAVADQLSVKGFIINQPDGTVYIEAEGDDFSLDSFLEWCQEGPDRAIVEKVEVVEGELKNYRNFEAIKRKANGG